MAIRKRGYVVYVGETTSSSDIYDIEPNTLQNGELYWVEYVEYNSIVKKKYFIYHKDVENVTAYISDHYIGCNHDMTDVNCDFISLGEWRESQMKTILDE